MQQYTVYLYLQTALHVSGGFSTHLPTAVSVTLTADSSNGLINARYCRYSDVSS